MIYISINNRLLPATISGMLHDESWGGRASKHIMVELTYQEALELFVDDVDWSIIEVNSVPVVIINDQGEEEIVEKEEEMVWDNSDYSIAGDIIDHRNGFITVKMGQPTAEELLELLVEAL